MQVQRRIRAHVTWQAAELARLNKEIGEAIRRTQVWCEQEESM